MNIESLRDYCIAKKGVSESFPFDDVTLVFKVMDKMFLLSSLNKDFSMNVKYYPDTIIELREEFLSVLPAYHMSKKHWNTVMIDGSVSEIKIKEWIDISYELVVSKMTKKKQIELNNL